MDDTETQIQTEEKTAEEDKTKEAIHAKDNSPDRIPTKKEELREREELIIKEEELQKREEAIEEKKKLGGETDGHAKSETEDEKWAKDAKERYEGTGLDPTPDDSPTEFK